MDNKRLKLADILPNDDSGGSYTLVLLEVDGKRRLPISVGVTEAQSIAVVVEGIRPERPMTHDLFKNFADLMQVELRDVLIKTYIKGVFYSSLFFAKDGEVFELDARTSDAIALAERFQKPIYATEQVLQETSFIIEQKRKEASVKNFKTIEEYSVEELLQLMKQMIKNEDYEKASDIRDEIARRKVSQKS